MDDSEITVSIIIPTYNRKNELLHTLKSVLEQSFKFFEVLVCDDGSTDGTMEMVFELNDPRIKWVSGQNGCGPAIPRNRGIAESKGEWLAFLDSDDKWNPDKLAKQLEALNDLHVKAACTNAFIMKNKLICDQPYFEDSFNSLISFSDMLKVNRVICSSMLVHRNIVEKVGGFPEDSTFRAIEDYALWLTVSLLTDIVYLSEPLVIYRDQPEISIRGDILESEQRQKNKILLECLGRIMNLKLAGPQKFLLVCKVYFVENLKYFVKKFLLFR